MIDKLNYMKMDALDIITIIAKDVGIFNHKNAKIGTIEDSNHNLNIAVISYDINSEELLEKKTCFQLSDILDKLKGYRCVEDIHIAFCSSNNFAYLLNHHSGDDELFNFNNCGDDGYNHSMYLWIWKHFE